MAGFLGEFAAITARDLVKAWPGGANKSDTVLAGSHLNLTALKYWNYTYYGNETVSNGSKCYLVFRPYQPVYLFGNGSFTNATSCYSAVDPIGTRGDIGIGFAAAFGICLVLVLVALAKHGRIHLAREKRFYPLGRRWQWYWGLFVCACGCIGLFMNIDIDRYYLQELPITVTVFFWYLMCLGTVALTWEAVRHWGSWLERQFIDPNPFVLQPEDRRATIEFWLPMWFYFWAWMNFFLVVPRNWTFPQKQRSPEQTTQIAMPTATSARFKAGAFCLVIAWLTIVFSLRHSIKHYKDRHRGLFNYTLGITKAIPLRFYFIIPLAAVLIAYQAYIAWEWNYSIVRVGAPVYVIFTLGYAPSLLILLIQIVYGYASPNEDNEIIRQRTERGEAIDHELGIVRKPSWWRRVKGEHLMSLSDKIASNVNEVGRQRATGRRIETAAERHVHEEALAAARDDAIEMSPIRRPAGENPRIDRAGVSAMQTSSARLAPSSLQVEREDGPAPPPYTEGLRSRPNSQAGSSRRGNGVETADGDVAPPYQVRSMLDI